MPVKIGLNGVRSYRSEYFPIGCILGRLPSQAPARPEAAVNRVMRNVPLEVQTDHCHKDSLLSGCQ